MRRSATALAALAALALAWVIVAGRPAGPWTAGALALLAAAGLVLRARAAGADPRVRARVVLLLALLPTLVHLHAAGGRMGGDGIGYYVYVRSMAKDLDVDFTNEYAHYGQLERPDLAVPTKTGLRRSVFAVGPGLAWLPFFGLGEVAARLDAFSGRAVDLSGYGPHHVNAVALGSALLGFAAVFLVHARLLGHFRAPIATGAALLLWFATFLYWYMVQHPAMSHAASTLGAAAVVAAWDAGRGTRSPRGYAVLGLLLGLTMCMRWQNGVLALLPGLELLGRLRDGGPLRSAIRDGVLLGAAMTAAALPQMITWHVLYGEWLLLHPPHGTDFLRLDRPFLLETLFSSRHGLLSWSPVLWIAYAGFVPLWRRRRALAWPLLPLLVLMTYVNTCAGDWWAGGSYSNRRFDSVLPILAFGLAAGLEALRGLVARHPGLATAAVVLASSLWSVLGVAQARAGALDVAAPPAFPRLAGEGARQVAGLVGSPPTWPASWIFAVRHRLPPAQYDTLVGRYLFFRQKNLKGLIAVGSGDGALLGEGWGDARDIGARSARPVLGRARVLAPLDGPEDIWLALLAWAPATTPVRIEVNGHPVGTVLVDGAWTERPVLAPTAVWRSDLNDVVLRTETPVWVEAIQATRAAAPPGEERGWRDR